MVDARCICSPANEHGPFYSNCPVHGMELGYQGFIHGWRGPSLNLDRVEPSGPIYEVWTVATANIWGAFDTEDEAWAAIRIAGSTHGPEYVEGLILAVEENGETRMLADGARLRAEAWRR